MFSKVIISALLALTSVSAATIPATNSIDIIKSRQLGGIACNIARLQVVSALGDAEDAVGQIQDADTQSAAQAGLDQANGGISEIASALVAGETAPDSGRASVEAGLTAMNTALSAADA